MREALNSNPMVQAAVVGVLILLASIFFLLPMLSKKSDSSSTESAATSTPTTAGTDPATAGAVPSTPGTVPPATGSVPPTSGSAPGTVPPAALIPGPGLPQRVIVSWARGDAIVLLVVRNGAVDDRLVRDSVRQLRGFKDLAVFTVHAKDIARYSRITQGVGVNRVPALVVIQPRSISGNTPQGEVHYGFRSALGIVQAVRDAFYQGKDNLPYSPR